MEGHWSVGFGKNELMDKGVSGGADLVGRHPQGAHDAGVQCAAGLRLAPLPQGVRLSSVQLQLRNPGDEEARALFAWLGEEVAQQRLSPDSDCRTLWGVRVSIWLERQARRKGGVS